VATATEPLSRARDAYRRRRWLEARDAFDAADADAALGPDDRYARASCAWWLGDLDEALPLLQTAYRSYLDHDDPGSAAMAALEVAYTLELRGDSAPASGWMRRVVRLLDDVPAGPEHGYLAYVGFENAFHGGDHEAAASALAEVRDLGARFGDPTLQALGVLGEGRLLVAGGRVPDGMALLDEAMLAAVSEDLDPSWTGNIYCHLIAACYDIADLRRAGEWTEATASWCEQMPGAGPFMGICRVHRAQVLQIRGDWERAEREASRVCHAMSHFEQAMVAEAHYQLGEIRRQRGDLDGAERELAAAHELGRDPQPGLALVRLARGQGEAATAAVRAALTAAGADPLGRARLLPAAVEILLATGHLDDAWAAGDELEVNASTYGTTGFVAPACHARGALELASGDPEAALRSLRRALAAWQELPAPYEVARVRCLLAGAYEELGDLEAAARERSAAAATFGELGAVGVEDAAGGVVAGGVAGVPVARGEGPAALTEREAEVLGLVASGSTNQQIADALVLSVRTVERHLATVYQKLGVSGRSARAAAVTHAHRTGLIRPSV
jgi:DNA-binding CsgD family transcriptional regulator